MRLRSSVLRAALLSAPLALTAPTASAHHGQEFLVVLDSSVPSMWTGTVFGGIEWSRDGRLDEFSTEPGFLLGLGSRLAAGATLGFSGTENDWGYESISPFLQVQITPPTWPVRIALMAGYHFADSGAEDPAITTSRRIPRPPAPQKTTPRPPAPPPDPPVDPDPPCGPEYGPDAPPCPETTPPPSATPGRKLRHAGHPAPSPPPAPAPPSPAAPAAPSAPPRPAPPPETATPEPYDGIHRHGENHAFARLIIEADLTRSDKLIFNLIGLWPEEGHTAWGYAAGYQHRFSHTFATGLEAIGDFGDANEHELIAAGYFSPTHSISVKLGAGIGLTEASPDVSLRTGIVWRF
jgi:hypothetical protein